MSGSDDPTEVQVVAALKQRGWTLATAESLTGGRIAERITSVPGASAVYTVGWVTYASAQKTRQLGVPAELIAAHGVVSGDVAVAMAEGALEHSGADVAVATTGCAGPDPVVEPGRDPVPVGRVYIATAISVFGRPHVPAAATECDFEGDRAEIQRQAADAALAHILGILEP